MKKTTLITAILVLTFVLVSCSRSEINSIEDMANDFLKLYYSQYTVKKKISEAFEITINEDLETQEPILTNGKNIDDYITDYFGEVLTENAKQKLPANRVIPDKRMLDSKIAKAEIVSVSFEEAENQREGTLSFKANILYNYEDGTETNSIESGLIWTEWEEEKLKIDGFRIDSKGELPNK